MKKIINEFLTMVLIFACQSVLAVPFKISELTLPRTIKVTSFTKNNCGHSEGSLSEKCLYLLDGLERTGSCDFA